MTLMKRTTLQALIKFLMRILTRTEYLGLENIPATGPVIIATNHMSRLDIPVLFNNPARPDINALVTTKYKKHWIIRWIIDAGEGIWLDRDTADFSAFRQASDLLKQGKCLAISPEGTRSHTDGLQEGKQGTILLALRCNVPIVPVGITGTKGGLKKVLMLGRPKLTATFGPAFMLEPVDRENREENMQRYTEEMMCRIAAVLPESYRGVYKDHQRLKELLAQPN
jgi:1-acyl-sn-glycerol-3-phosphate acyltransferase